MNSPMIRTLAIILFLLAALPAQAENVQPLYGPRLENFKYPYPVSMFQIEAQEQKNWQKPETKLEMAYMDVAPTGAANGKTVALLHGKNFCGATWEKTIKELSAKGYRVVVPDQIGFCKSSKPETYQYSLNQLALNTNKLLQQLGIAKATIMGHSMGGMLAMRYALSYPDQVEQLVLVNPIGLEDWQAKGVPYAPITALYEGELKTTYDSIKAYQLKFYYNNVWKPEYDRWVAMLADMYAGTDRNLVALNQARISDMIFTQPVIHEAVKIKAPTLLIIGGKDRTAPGANRAPKELAETLGNYPVLGRETAKLISGSTLVELPELGHSPQVEAPEQFHKAMFENLR